VSSLERRLERLEAGAGKDAASRWEVPIGTRVYFKMVERYRSRVAGEEVPPYAQEEIEEMRRHDLETVSGNGVRAYVRDSPGWQTLEAQQLLEEWEEVARRRLETAKDLPPERWHEVWGSKDEE
jgi:hypothetical protein